MTDAAVVFVLAVPVFGLASVLAERDVAVVSALALIFIEPDLAAALVLVVVAFHDRSSFCDRANL